jgi:hypothetical protein
MRRRGREFQERYEWSGELEIADEVWRRLSPQAAQAGLTALQDSPGFKRNLDLIT